MTENEMMDEIKQLILKYKNGEISYADLYYALLKYPANLRDKAIALYILTKPEEHTL